MMCGVNQINFTFQLDKKTLENLLCCCLSIKSNYLHFNFHSGLPCLYLWGRKVWLWWCLNSFIGVKPLAHMIVWDISSLPPALVWTVSSYHPTLVQLITCSLLITNWGQIPISNGHYKCHSSLSSLQTHSTLRSGHTPDWTRAAVNLILW